MLSTEQIGRGFYTDFAVTQDATGDVVWLSSLEGGVFQWRDDELTVVMDTSVPMATGGTPRTLIVRRTVNGETLSAPDAAPTELAGRRVMIEYAAISTRRPEGIEFSYRLTGQDQAWSTPTSTRSIGFSSLAPGDYVFEVRSRFPAGDWSAARSWAFVVPTPYYQQTWFIALALLLGAALTWAVVQLRLRSVARLNKRLRQEVLERTQSIDQQRQELQAINEQLSSEIVERQRSDAMRADMEARFHQAYQNSPVGMALVDEEGLVYDANPTLKALFWPTALPEDRKPLLHVVVENERDRLARFLDDYAADAHDSDSMEVDCLAHNGDVRRIDFLPSAVRDHDGALQYIVLVANDVTESRAMTRQLEYQARFDELTGLVNRRAFADQLKTVGATARERGGYLMFLDLDQFKVVNDTCGHAAGDELLRKVAKLLTVGVREQDTVARLGGDEFALIMVGCSEQVALRRAEHIRKSIADLEFLWDAKAFRIGVSIGVVPIKDSDRDLDELQQLADAACYAAKDAGRNRVHLVAGKSDEVHVQRGEMRWVQRLSQAIDTNSFQLFGQRIVPTAPRDGQRDRVEVLLRMKDKACDRLIPPGAFLPAAERYGMVGRLDQWVINRIIELLADTPEAALGASRYWLNLSGASVGDGAFSRNLVQAVANSGLPPGVLNFEITETAVIRKIDEATRLIAALRAMGCHFALDDFGSGLSSFGYLKKLNVDVLKVDGQFIRDILHDPTDRIFVKSIIDIAHTLDMRVVAEFVEDEPTLAMIRDMGCDFGQGFGIHRPEPLINLLPAATGSQSQLA